ncbi:hypothetical protein GGF44_003792, partial [Coemansia sp. RSA 1694]
MEQAGGKDVARSFSDSSDRRLPSNAQQQQISSASQTPSPAPQSIRSGSAAIAQDIRRGSAAIAQATGRLASTPASFPRSVHLDAASMGGSSPVSDSSALDKVVAARRLKRHLVTRGSSGGGDAGRRASASSRAGHASAPVVGDEEEGYAGDVNDDEADDDGARVP